MRLLRMILRSIRVDVTTEWNATAYDRSEGLSCITRAKLLDRRWNCRSWTFSRSTSLSFVKSYRTRETRVTYVFRFIHFLIVSSVSRIATIYIIVEIFLAIKEGTVFFLGEARERSSFRKGVKIRFLYSIHVWIPCWTKYSSYYTITKT